MEKTENKETYVFFKDFPDFTPMFNPHDMLAYGIHEGVVLNPKYGIKFKKPGELDDFKRLGLVKDIPQDLWFANEPSIQKNYYKVQDENPPFAVMPVIDSMSWFEWYLHMYYGSRNPWDAHYINWWEQMILWGWHKETPKTHRIDQMLLSYSWNPGWKPKIIKGYKDE